MNKTKMYLQPFNLAVMSHKCEDLTIIVKFFPEPESVLKEMKITFDISKYYYYQERKS